MRPAPQLAPLDLDTIRRLWKPRRDSYADARLYEENRIRLHRAFSWLERAERCGEAQLDDRYLAQWAALMALASRWDEGRGAPVAERTALAAFVRQVFATDHDGVMPATLERERARAIARAIARDRSRAESSRTRASSSTVESAPASTDVSDRSRSDVLHACTRTRARACA